MARRRKRAEEPVAAADGPPVCPLCERVIPPGARSSRHHLTPKLKGGARGPTVLMHHICHRAIHARFAEAELARRLNGVEALRNDPDLADFIAWVRTKPADFHAPTAVSEKLRDNRNAARLRR